MDCAELPAICGQTFDARAFQVVVPRLGQSFDRAECALQALENPRAAASDVLHLARIPCGGRRRTTASSVSAARTLSASTAQADTSGSFSCASAVAVPAVPATVSRASTFTACAARFSAGSRPDEHDRTAADEHG